MTREMKALVTGSAGFVGRHVAADLAVRGWSVAKSDISVYAGGVDCLVFFRGNTTRYDLVAHCAARSPHRAAIDGQPETTVYNQLLDAAMFEWAIRTRQRRILYISSCAVYPASLQCACEPDIRLSEDHRINEAGGPSDGYGWTKLTGEQMAAAANAAGVPVHVVRPFSGYGEDQGEDWPFGAFVARAKRREDPFTIWGDGSQVRDWIYVSDVVKGALAVVDADVREPVNLCTGIGTSMTDLAQMVCDAAGYSPEFEFDLRAPAGVAWRVGDLTRMSTFYTSRVSLAEGVARAFA